MIFKKKTNLVNTTSSKELPLGLSHKLISRAHCEMFFFLYFAYIYDICLEILVIFAPIICAEKFNTYEICLQASEQTKGKSSNSLGK